MTLKKKRRKVLSSTGEQIHISVWLYFHFFGFSTNFLITNAFDYPVFFPLTLIFYVNFDAFFWSGYGYSRLVMNEDEKYSFLKEKEGGGGWIYILYI